MARDQAESDSDESDLDDAAVDAEAAAALRQLLQEKDSLFDDGDADGTEQPDEAGSTDSEEEDEGAKEAAPPSKRPRRPAAACEADVARTRLTQAELQKVQEAMRHELRAKSVASYKSYWNKWEWFSEKNGYDGLLIGEGGEALSVRFLQWLKDGAIGYTQKRGRKPKDGLSVETWTGCHSALQTLFCKQSVAVQRPGAALLLHIYPTYNKYFYGVKAELQGHKGDRSTERDPQEGTLADVLGPEQYQRLVTHMVDNDTPTGALYAAAFTRMTNTLGRSDDLRLNLFADVMLDVRENVGPFPGVVLANVLAGSKTQKNGAKGYKGSLRHREPALCDHGALGRMLVQRFFWGARHYPTLRTGKRG